MASVVRCELLLFHGRNGKGCEEQEDASRQQGVDSMAMIELTHDPSVNQSVGDLRNRDEEVEDTHIGSHLFGWKTV